MSAHEPANIDRATVKGFGDEWAAFDQHDLDEQEHRRAFEEYFGLFPFDQLGDAEGFDMGCGSGRWAALVAPRVRKLHCLDPSARALDVCRRRLSAAHNVVFHHAAADDNTLADGSQDFGYSLGVLHHIPDTELAMKHCVAKLRPGAPFLVYLYYDFGNRPSWFRMLWRASDLGRKVVSKLPFELKRLATEIIATTVYFPLARSARAAERLGVDVSNWPLSHYRTVSYYTMRTDALDRFGTRLEQRFSRKQIEIMMARCGLVNIRFSDHPPFWIAIATKR